MLLVTAALIEQAGQFLLARRSPGKHLAGYWEFPGGKVEPNESDEACLAREIQEELGLQIEVGVFFMETTYQYPEKTILLKAFFSKVIGGDLRLQDHDEIAWVAPSQFHQYLFAPADLPIVHALIATYA